MRTLLEAIHQWRLERAKELIRRSGTSYICNVDLHDVQVTGSRSGRARIEPAPSRGPACFWDATVLPEGEKKWS